MILLTEKSINEIESVLSDYLTSSPECGISEHSLEEVSKRIYSTLVNKWTKIEAKVIWSKIQLNTLYLLLHEDGEMSIGIPYEIADSPTYSFPKMTVTHYMELPDYPDGFFNKK